MTIEEALKGLKALRRDFSGYKPNEEMFDTAINILKLIRDCDETSATKCFTCINEIKKEVFKMDNSEKQKWIPVRKKMTREEAIKQLKKLKSFHNGSYGEAINFAIESLKVDLAYEKAESNGE